MSGACFSLGPLGPAGQTTGERKRFRRATGVDQPEAEEGGGGGGGG